MKETAIIYYSLANGNTYSIARRVQQQAGGRLIRIETVRPYTGSYDNIVAAGRPALLPAIATCRYPLG